MLQKVTNTLNEASQVEVVSGDIVLTSHRGCRKELSNSMRDFGLAFLAILDRI